MAAVRPMLDDVELQQVQQITVDGDQVLVEHGVPALEGNFLQRLNRRATRITLSGVLTGAQAGEQLKTLRDKFRAAEPVSFIADITTATQMDQVIIGEMGVVELAGKPQRFAYAFTLREFVPPPPPREEPPPPEPEPPAIESGILVVEVIVEGQPDFDFSAVTVTVEGTQEDGTTLSRTLTNRENNIWTEAEMPPGAYTVSAAVTASPLMTGMAPARVSAGQTTQSSITLRATSNIATTFIVHFRFDKAFVEPCMRPVLRQVAQYAAAHRSEKLVIIGHTDKAGSSSYNQSLSERRARAVFAYLTFGLDTASRTAALTDWIALRETRPAGQLPTLRDSWGARQYQHILQDLGFYPGAVDGDHGPLTDEAVRAYRCHKGLPPGANVDDEVWRALIEDYLAQDALAVPARQFFPNCPDEILKWLGCGEEDPLDRRGTAFRPSRRVELLFVQSDRLPCQVPQPVTFDLPEPGAVNSSWCLGPGSASSHCCLVSPVLQPGRNNPQPCPADPSGPWCRQPAEPGTITVQGSIQRERPDGTLEPVPNQAFVLIAPNGRFKADEQPNGEPAPARTRGGSGADRGTFQFPDLPLGIYSLEVVTPPSAPVLIRLLEANDREIKGNAVCKALRANSDRLDVVIVNAPVLREIRLPVVAHLMTPLNLTNREIRTCPDPANPANQVAQATTRSEADIRTLFEGANRVWRQARVRFELTDIIHETYAHPIEDPTARGSCAVDGNEFQFLLARCAYPDAVNVFFFHDFVGSGEAGLGISVESGATGGLPGGCAVADQTQITFGGVLINHPLDTDQSTQALAHELGHYLNLDHADDTPANANRLMLPGTFAGANRTLTTDEVNRSRTARGATDDCVPLSLRVTGATQVGGSLSNQFIVIQNPSGAVTVDAELPDRLVAPGVGTLTMTGGTPGANPRQQTISAATTGVTEVVATYTPAAGTPVITTRVVIQVVSFTLQVTGDVQAGVPAGANFFTTRNATAVLTVVANINPPLFCVPTTLVTWSGGTVAPDPLRRRVSRAAVGTTTISATLAGTTRSVTIRVIQLDVITTPVAGAPAATSVRFGLWDHAYDAAGNIRNDAPEPANFVGADKRKFHIRVHDPAAVGPVHVNWKTQKVDNTDDDAPASAALTLVETAPGTKVFISKAVMLVTDNVDRDVPTHSGFVAPAADAGLRNAGQSNHRTRKAALDGFVRVEYSPAAGVQLPVTLPIFDRSVQFTVNDAVDTIGPGVRTLTPAAMAGTVGGVSWSIKVGSVLTIDSGANQEVVTVTAITATTFTAQFTRSHDGTTTPFPITGTTDERRRLNVRVVRYTNPGVAAYVTATPAYIATQFEHANQRWNQIGLQIVPGATADRVVPAGALNAASRFPFVHPNGAQERAVLRDLLPTTPDNTLTVVFIPIDGVNAYAALLAILPIPVPGGAPLTVGDRFFIFIDTALDRREETLAHELHHVLFNRGDIATGRQFFTLNTNSPLTLVAGTGIALPDARIYRRIQNLHSPDPDNDAGNNNVINWARRRRAARFPVDGSPGPATASTGNTLTSDF